MVHLYLQQLLNERKVVIVPELGQFTLIETPSTFDAQSGQFHPATRTIVFEESKRFEPSDFANTVAEAENTSVESVLHAIRSLIYDLRKNITESGQFHLVGLGNFLIDDRFNLTFVQSEEPNFDNFGLPDIEIIAIEREADNYQLSALEDVVNEALPVEASEVQKIVSEEPTAENQIELPIPHILLELPILESSNEPDVPLVEQSDNISEFAMPETIAEPEELIAPSDEEEKVIIVKPELQAGIQPESEAEIAESEQAEKEIVDEEEDAKDPTLTWPVIMLMVLVVVISGFGIYYYMNYVNPASENIVLNSDTTNTDTASNLEEANITNSENSTSNALAENSAPQVNEIPEKAKVKQPEIAEPAPKPETTTKPDATKPVAVTEAPKAATVKAKPINDGSVGNFKVVAGAFGVEENAQKLVAIAKSKGYDATIIPLSGSKVKFKVAIGSFATEAEAKALKEKAQTDFTERLLIMK